MYLFLEKWGGKEKEGERNISVRETHQLIGCLSHAPKWGPSPQPSHVAEMVIELATFWFPGQHSVH